MSTRKVSAVIGVSFAALSLAGLVTAQVLTGEKVEKRLVTEHEYKQKEREDATPVRPGSLTERQRIHSGLYRERRRTDKSLRQQSEELASAGQSGDVTITTSPGTPVFSPEPGKKNTPLEEAVNDADAVVIVTVKGKESQPTEDEKYVFTDYEVSVTEVLKNHAASPLSAADTLTVTRPGGKVLLDGRLITVVDEGVKPLHVGGEYLLFLKYVPQTGAYATLSERSSGFKLNHGKVKALTEGAGYAKKQEGRDSRSLKAEARAAARKRGDSNE